eukprot:COSAG02_NODE_14909_length_1224_cov_1.224000_1_plen_119_part_10
MQKLGIPCACLPKYADGFTPAMQEKLLDEIVKGTNQARALFLTPEKLEADAKSSSRTICNALKKLSQSKRIGIIVSDHLASLQHSKFCRALCECQFVPADVANVQVLDEAHELVLGEDH